MFAGGSLAAHVCPTCRRRFVVVPGASIADPPRCACGEILRTAALPSGVYELRRSRRASRRRPLRGGGCAPPIAEARDLGFGDSTKVRAISAGTEPRARVHLEVVEAMREVGIDLSSVVPQLLTDELAETATLVNMGCGEACPALPGLRRMDWPLEDPKGKPIARVREIRDDVRGRVAELLRAEGWGPA